MYVLFIYKSVVMTTSAHNVLRCLCVTLAIIQVDCWYRYLMVNSEVWALLMNERMVYVVACAAILCCAAACCMLVPILMCLKMDKFHVKFVWQMK
jgi:hypothetical protein